MARAGDLARFGVAFVQVRPHDERMWEVIRTHGKAAAVGRAAAVTKIWQLVRAGKRRPPADDVVETTEVTVEVVEPPELPDEADEAAEAPALDPVEQLHQTLRYLDDNFERLKDACATDAEREQVLNAWATAHENHARALAAAFDANDDEIRQLTGEIADAQSQVRQLHIDQQNIANIINLVTAAVRTGASLLAVTDA